MLGVARSIRSSSSNFEAGNFLLAPSEAGWIHCAQPAHVYLAPIHAIMPAERLSRGQLGELSPLAIAHGEREGGFAFAGRQGEVEGGIQAARE